MGLPPQQFNAMSPWQWAAAFEGWFEANASEEAKRDVMMSDDDFDAASRMLEG